MPCAGPIGLARLRLAEFKATAAGADIPGYVQKGDEYTYAKHGFVATSYALTTDQYGTQLDPPAHWDEYGATISDLPPTYAVRPLVVIPIREKVAAIRYHTERAGCAGLGEPQRPDFGGRRR